MAECLAAADIVICRAGATTISELQASKKPAILIPSPNVAENHQYYNALALVNSNAGSMIEEKNLTCQSLMDEIEKITDVYAYREWIHEQKIDKYKKEVVLLSEAKYDRNMCLEYMMKNNRPVKEIMAKIDEIYPA